VFLYEGTDPKGGIPAWRDAYQLLQKDCGKILAPDIHVAGKHDSVNPEALAIAAAANADLTGQTRMVPARQPAGMRVFARFFTAIVQGQKWYYVNVVYDPA
jgi:hypothetical protein